MTLKNAFLKKTLHLLRSCQRRKPFISSEKRFLVVTTTGLGDTLWATPAIKALRQTYPSAYIAVLTSLIGGEVLAHNRRIDELFLVKDPALPSLVSLYRTLRKRNIGTTLLFHTSQRPILPFCALITEGEIIGTEGQHKGLDDLLTVRLKNRGGHEIAKRLDIAEAAGAQSLDPTLELSLSEHDEKTAKDFLESLMLPPYLPIVGFHPGAKDRFKQWPPSHFVELGNRLVHDLGCQILITGNEKEAALAGEIASKIRGAISIAGKLPLRPFAALLRSFSLMISNDTGPMHVAFAVGTPTIALFAPTNARLCGPYSSANATVIQKSPTCTPCLRKKCPEPFCLLQIGPQEVFDAATKQLYTDKRQFT